MATLFELNNEINSGRKVKRKKWDQYITKNVAFIYEDASADDWELEPLPKVKKKITMYQVVYRTYDDSVAISSYLYESKETFVKVVGVSSDKIMRLIPIELEVEE